MLVSTSPRLAAWLQSASRLRICFSIAAGSTGGGTGTTGCCGGGDEQANADAQTIKRIADRPSVQIFFIAPPGFPSLVEQDANAENRSQAFVAWATWNSGLRVNGRLYAAVNNPAQSMLIFFTYVQAHWRTPLRPRLEFRGVGRECSRGAPAECRNRVGGCKSRRCAGYRKSAGTRDSYVRDSIEGARAGSLRSASRRRAARRESGSRLPRRVHASALALFHRRVPSAHP